MKKPKPPRLRPYLAKLAQAPKDEAPKAPKTVFIMARSPREAAVQAAKWLVPYTTMYGTVNVQTLSSGVTLEHWSSRITTYEITFGRQVLRVDRT